MRYRRPKPSIVLATLAVALVASPFVTAVGSHDLHLTDDRKPAPTTDIEQIPLRDLPAVVLDVASSGLRTVGVDLPSIDPNLFPVPDVTIPVPRAALPSSESPSAQSPSTTQPRTTQPPATHSPAAPSPDASPRARPGRKTPGTAKTGQRRTPPAPRMADGRPVGAAVTSIVRDKPIKMVAFTWDRPVDAEMKLRAKRSDGRWGPWTALEMVSDAARATAAHPTGTEPVWVGDAKEVQVATTRDGLAIPAAEPQGGGLPQLAIGTASRVIGDLAKEALPAIKATLISPEGLLSLGSSMLTPLLGGPQVVARAQWGADEGMRCSQPAYSPTVRGAIVHHTAGSNDYSPQQSVEIVRGIYAYHARTLNWCDIGYNVLVDKYGQIFEGAFGGLDRNVEGTHTGGFNKSTIGLSMIGNLDQVAPSAAMVSAASRFLRWRLGKAGLNPAGTATLTADYFSDSKFPAGATTSLPMIAGHRDYNNTSCPGNLGYPALAQIRALAGGAPANPPADPAAPANPGGPPPAQPGQPPAQQPPAQAPPAAR